MTSLFSQSLLQAALGALKPMQVRVGLFPVWWSVPGVSTSATQTLAQAAGRPGARPGVSLRLVPNFLEGEKRGGKGEQRWGEKVAVFYVWSLVDTRSLSYTSVKEIVWIPCVADICNPCTCLLSRGTDTEKPQLAMALSHRDMLVQNRGACISHTCRFMYTPSFLQVLRDLPLENILFWVKQPLNLLDTHLTNCSISGSYDRSVIHSWLLLPL